MEEKDFKKIMQDSKLEVMFPDFEEEVMDKVKAKEAVRRSVWRNLKLSWIFFFIGAFFGVFVTHFFTDMEIPYLGENSKLVFLFIEILIVLVITSQLDNLIRFTFRKKV